MRKLHAILFVLVLASACESAPFIASETTDQTSGVFELKPVACSEVTLAFERDGSRSATFVAETPMTALLLVQAQASFWKGSVDLTVESNSSQTLCAVCMTGDTTFRCGAIDVRNKESVIVTANGKPSLPAGFAVTLLVSSD